ncbi:MAG TPA: MFS transporter [Syntrophorhabdales bacterium]|nr:MFS transporter [Syntrophorhabdales bacterium]
MHYAWVITFTGVLVVLFAHGFGRMSYSVILPFMKEDLSLTYTQVGLIATGNFIGYLLFTTFGGFLAARFGPRKIISISLLVTGITLFLTGFSNSFSFAFVTRLITGAGNGGCFVPMVSLPAAWFVARKRGLAIGIVNIGVCMGLSLSGLLLPLCIKHFGPQEGWRYAWYLMGGGVFLCSFLCFGLVRNNPHEKGLRMYGEESCGEQSAPPQTMTLFAAFRRVMTESEIWKLGCVYFMYGFSYMIYLTFFVAYLTKEVGMDTAAAGRIFAIIGIVAIFGGVLWGFISDVIGRRYGCVCIYLVLAVSYALPGFFKGVQVSYLSAVMFGIAFSVPVLMAAAAADAVGGQLAPAALGVITLIFAIAQIFGPFVGGWVKDATGTFRYAFMLSAAIALAGALSSLLLKKKEST